jgi:ABC-2 type transport system ATP-binding protein
MMRDAVALSAATAISAQGLTKRFGDVRAVERLDLEIPAGEFFGLLGPNGSGKSTTVHMLATLIRPTAGGAQVAGCDVLTRGSEVRRAIGVVFQESALDRSLTAWENLRFAGALHGLSARETRVRADELLALTGLTEKRNTPLAALSGGMRRALDIARGVIHRPRVLFLDEPSTGLDLMNRRRIWRFIDGLRRETGMTVFLTTHYLEEAAGCDRVAFIKAGAIVRRGVPPQLVAALGDYIVEIEASDAQALAQRFADRLGPCIVDHDCAFFRVRGELAEFAELQAELAPQVATLQVRRPNLNDVFLWVNEPELRS